VVVTCVCFCLGVPHEETRAGAHQSGDSSGKLSDMACFTTRTLTTRRILTRLHMLYFSQGRSDSWPPTMQVDLNRYSSCCSWYRQMVLCTGSRRCCCGSFLTGLRGHDSPSVPAFYERSLLHLKPLNERYLISTTTIVLVSHAARSH
jgi:hypothetical protein